MYNVKILIVEDDIIIADYIKDILVGNSYDNVKMANSVSEAKERFDNYKPDIILMDINLDGEYEGVELSKVKNKNAHVVFITGQTDSKTVDKALSTSPASYLTKPIREVDLVTAIKIIVSKIQKDYLFVKDGYTDIKLKYDDIVYIQADKNYLDIITINSTYTIRHTLKDFVKDLSSSFKQIHRSIVVNDVWIEKISSDEVLIRGFKLPISRNFKSNL